MATKKAVKKAPTKSAGKGMTVWEAKMAELAQKATKVEEHVGSGGNFIGTRGGVLMYNGAEVPGNEMDVVVIDHIIENAYYGDRYDADNPGPPSCFALGRDDKDMAPHENSSEKQSDACAGCPMNEFGSAETGRGKACKNIRRLALITADQLDNVADAEVAYIKVPVTSVKGWAGYVRQLATTLNRPPLGVITRISLHRDDKTQFKMKFELIEQIEDAEAFEALIAKSEAVAPEIEFPYQPADEQEERPRKKGKPQRKAGRAVPQQPQRSASKPQRQPPAKPASAPAGKGKAGQQRPAGKPAKAAPAPAAGGKKRKF